MATNTLQTEVLVQNKRGLHMRAAGKLCALAMQFTSEIQISKGRKSSDAKSVLDLMSLSAAPGTTLNVTATGEDAQAALDAVVNFFNTYTEEP